MPAIDSLLALHKDSNGNTLAVESTTNLGAGGSMTQTSRDNGTLPTKSRYRVLVMHNASANQLPGHLFIEQSTDGTTWRETHRVPIPQDGKYRFLEFPWALRYIRAGFANGSTAQTGFFLASCWVGFDGSFDFDKPLQFVDISQTLAISGVWNGPALNLGANHSFLRMRAMFTADQAGTAYVEQSRDGTNWRVVASQAVTAGTPTSVEALVVAQYVRLRYANGAVAQATPMEVLYALLKE